MKFAFRKVLCLLSAVTLLAWTPLTVSATDLDKEAEQIMYLVNLQRIANGAQPLKTTPFLNQLASTRAEEISTTFSHMRPDGSSCFSIFKQADIEYWNASENIAWSTINTPEEIVQIWLESTQGHRENLLNPVYTHTGVGVFETGGRVYCSQLFILPKNALQGEYTPEDTTPKLTGDINQDGFVNVNDVVYILVDSANAATTGISNLTKEQVESSDFNGDNLCNSVDASYILQFCAYIGAGGTSSIVDWFDSTH